MQQEKILITGGAGFIGSAVIRYVLDKTALEVVNVDKLTYAGNIQSIPDHFLSERYNFEKIDICDQEAISAVYQLYKPTKVLHLAAESHVDRSIDSPGEFIQTNVIGTYNLLMESTKYFESLESDLRNSFRFHHVSTDEVYGDLGEEGFFTEQTPYSPSSPYSASKASSDHLVRAWGRTYGLPILITNCSNNYGPYHFPEKLIPHMILNALDGSPLPLYGKGDQIRDWLYVEDHAKALLKVLFKGSIGETYNIGGFNEKTNLEVVNEICSLLEELSPTKPKNITNYSDLITFVSDRPGHDMRYAIDSSKVSKDLGWMPEESFSTGLRKTVQWYLDNRSWWENIISGRYKLERIGV